ncbi:glycosyltransferase family 2 protein [Agreia sp. VKM Ac-1783]|uniref:glycosyltransferase family 2 protein n=1 Tax=Agreia sp. VKM Ac-1783 TaxID=1938889 RepID=UPI0024B34F18|nr:glycosyltransferase family 2 protein [Agreia sp. VKM Ac-1783]
MVVNYNGGELVAECLDSLIAADRTGLDVEIVVVDNASADGSDRMIQQRYPSVRLVRSAVNLGFGGGVNLGIRQSRGDLVVLVNSDARVQTNFLRAIAEPFNADEPRLGAVTARIQLTGRFRETPLAGAEFVSADGRGWERVLETDIDGVELMNSTGGQISSSGNGSDRSWLQPVEEVSPDATVFGFCGGGAAIRRSTLDDVGLFDERLFMYYEDTDLSWRMRRAGWDIRYADAARTVHHHAASSGTSSQLFLVNNIRNRVLVSARNAPMRMVALAGLRTVLGLIRLIVRAYGPTRDAAARRRARATVTALGQVAARLPRYLSDRRRIDRSAAVPRDFIALWTIAD